MSSLVLAGDFRELTDEEMQQVNGGATVLGTLLIGTVTGAIIGGVDAWREGRCWQQGAISGSVKGVTFAAAKAVTIGTKFYSAARAVYWSVKAGKATEAVR